LDKEGLEGAVLSALLADLNEDSSAQVNRVGCEAARRLAVDDEFSVSQEFASLASGGSDIHDTRDRRLQAGGSEVTVDYRVVIVSPPEAEEQPEPAGAASNSNVSKATAPLTPKTSIADAIAHIADSELLMSKITKSLAETGTILNVTSLQTEGPELSAWSATLMRQRDESFKTKTAGGGSLEVMGLYAALMCLACLQCCCGAYIVKSRLAFGIASIDRFELEQNGQELCRVQNLSIADGEEIEQAKIHLKGLAHYYVDSMAVMQQTGNRSTRDAKIISYLEFLADELSVQLPSFAQFNGDLRQNGDDTFAPIQDLPQPPEVAIVEERAPQEGSSQSPALSALGGLAEPPVAPKRLSWGTDLRQNGDDTSAPIQDLPQPPEVAIVEERAPQEASSQSPAVSALGGLAEPPVAPKRLSLGTDIVLDMGADLQMRCTEDEGSQSDEAHSAGGASSSSSTSSIKDKRPSFV